MPEQPSEKAMQRMRRLVENFTEKSGTYTSPVEGVTESVILGLAQNVDEVGHALHWGGESAPATICRSTSIATACCSWTRTECRSPSICPKTTKARRCTALSRTLIQTRDEPYATRPRNVRSRGGSVLRSAAMTDDRTLITENYNPEER